MFKRLSTLFVCVSLFALVAKGSITEMVNNNASPLVETLTAPTDLSLNAVSTSPKCYGGNDGEIRVEIIAGSGDAPFSYRYRKEDGTWSSWVPNQPLSFKISGLSSGTYEIQTKDSNSNENNKTVTIKKPDPLKVELEQPVEDPSCSGGTVDLKFEAQGGTSPYTYQLYKNGTQDGGTNNDGDFLGKGTGEYSLSVTDSVGCLKDYNSNINVEVPSPIDISTRMVKEITCDNDFASVKVNGVPAGTSVVIKNNTRITTDSPYTYAGDYLYNNLDAGDYTVTVTRNGCPTDTDSETFSIDGFSEVKVVLDPATNQSLKCANDLASVNVTVNGGRADREVRVVLDNNDGNSANDPERDFVYGNSFEFTNVNAGTYSIRWFDSENEDCSGVISYTINAPTSVLEYLADPTFTDVSCNGGSDGTVQISVTGGTGAKTYYVNDVSKDDPSKFALPRGTYTVYVEDANLCRTEEKTVTINEPEPLTIAVTTTTDVSCPKGTDGSAELKFLGGSGSYIYNLSGPVSRPNISSTATPRIEKLSAGDYTVTVTDTKVCTSTPAQVKFTIGEPTEITIDLFEVGEIQCYGSTTSLKVQASGGLVSPLKYKLYAGNNLLEEKSSSDLAEFADIKSGSYTIKIEGDPNCSFTDTTFVVGARKQLEVLNLQPTIEVACPGDLGKLTLALKGEEPLSYSVDGETFVDYTTTPTIEGLMAERGTGMSHSIKIVDKYGCEQIVTVNVIEPEPLIYSELVVTELDCRSGNNGTVSVKISGGTPRYTATMNEVSKISNDDVIQFTKVPAGSYNIEVKDSKNCSLDSISVEIIEPAEDFVLSVPVFDSIRCFDGTTDLEITTTGGWNEGAVNYTIKGGGTDDQNQTGIFSSLKSGKYTITATDTRGCLATTQVDIYQPTRLAMTYGKIDITCKDRNDGKIIVKAEGGTAPYFYGHEGSSSSFYPFAYETIDTVKFLSPGIHYLAVQDANGCVSSVQEVSFVEPDPIELSVIYSDVICFGENNGKILLSAEGGVGVKTFTIQAPAVADRSNTSGSFENLPPADYQLLVADANGCSIPQPLTATIAEPKEIFIREVESYDVKCFGSSDGEIVVTAAGGEPYDHLLYSLEGYAMAPQTKNNISGLKSESYTVVVTDSREKCAHKWSVPIIIGSPDKLEIITNVTTDVTCHDVQDGSIIRKVKGGTPSYWFKLYDTESNLVGNVPGTDGTYLFEQLGNKGVRETYYNLEIIDGNGCLIKENNIRINNPDSIVVKSVDLTDVTCKGLNNGIIAINAVGGVGTLQYSLDGGSTYTPATSTVFGSLPGRYSNLKPGEYEPWLIDDNGCFPMNYERGARVKVAEPEELIGEYKMTEISCFGTNDGIVEINAKGGNFDKPYWYSIDDTVSWSNDSIFTKVVPGIKRLWVKDWKNCIDEIDVVEMVEPKEFVMTFDTTSITCADDDNATIVFNASGGEAPYFLGVDPLFATVTESFANTIKRESLGSVQEYIYYMKDSRDCPVNVINGLVIEKPNTEKQIFKHKFFNPAEFYIASVDTFPEKCAGEGRGKMIIKVTGGVEPYQYNVRLSESATPYHSNWSESNTVSGLIAGSYLPLILDDHKCTPLNDTTEYNNVVIGAINDTIMSIEIWDGDKAQCPYSKDAWVELKVDNTYENTFNWTLTSAGGTSVPIRSGSNELDSMVSIKNLNSGEYEFTITDLKSLCETSLEFPIEFMDSVCEEMLIPTAFTPNGDGYNDTWVLENTELYSHIKIQVFSVEGELVLDVDGPLDPEWAWDGKYKGQDLPVGTYIWLIWKNYDYVGKVEKGLASSTTTAVSDSTNVSSPIDTSKKSGKALAKPDFVGNVTILRGVY